MIMLLKKMLKILVPDKWSVDNYLLKVSFVRSLLLESYLKGSGILEQAMFSQKISVINDFLESLINDPEIKIYFSKGGFGDKEEGEKEDSSHGRLKEIVKNIIYDFHEPNRAFHNRFRDYLISINTSDEVRYFILNDLIGLDKKIITLKKKSGYVKTVFPRNERKEFDKFFNKEYHKRALPERYIKHFFPRFNPTIFIKKNMEFHLHEDALFSPAEAVASIDSF